MVMLNGEPLITTLGGTGLAISSNCSKPEMAAKFARFVADASIQSRLYFDHGGQPGHRKSWEAFYPNAQSQDFFKDTLPALDRAFLRPRYHGHLFFQDNAGSPIRQFMMKGGNPQQVLNSLNQLYQQSLNI